MTIEEQKRQAKQGLVAGLKPDYPYKSGLVLSLDGSVFRGGSKHHIWVQPVGVDTSPVVVFSQNPLTDVQAGWEVIYQQSPEPPEVWQLLRFNKADYAQQTAELSSFPDPGLPLHAQEHVINRDQVGSDPLMVYGRMIARFNVQPTNPASMKLIVLPGSYAGAEYHEFITNIRVTNSLSGNVPSTSNMARLVAISQDVDGELVFTNGTEFSKSEEVPPKTAYPNVSSQDELLAVLYLEQGTTSITNTNFRYDQRNIGNGGTRARVSEVHTPNLSTVALQTDANGDVGIGTSSPATPLHISGGSSGQTPVTDTHLTVENDGNTFVSLLAPDVNFTGIVFGRGSTQTEGSVLYDNTNRQMSLRVANDQIAMRINSDLSATVVGDVGVGQTSPSKALHVGPGTDTTTHADDGIYAAMNGTTQIAARNNTDNVEGGILSHANGNVYMGAWTNHPLVLRTNNANAITIDTDGDVGVGTSFPEATMHISQTSSTGAQEVLRLRQDDVSEAFTKYVGRAASANLTQSIVSDADVTTATLIGWIKINVQDDGNQISDQAYYQPIYTLA